MSVRRRSLFLPSALCLLLCGRVFAADVYLGLQAYGGAGKALGVGLLNFTAGSPNPQTGSISQTLRAVVREDLLFTRYFNIVEGGPQPGSGGKLDSLAWGSLGAQVAISGEVQYQDQTVNLECKILD